MVTEYNSVSLRVYFVCLCVSRVQGPFIELSVVGFCVCLGRPVYFRDVCAFISVCVHEYVLGLSVTVCL